MNLIEDIPLTYFLNVYWKIALYALVKLFYIMSIIMKYKKWLNSRNQYIVEYPVHAPKFNYELYL